MSTNTVFVPVLFLDLDERGPLGFIHAKVSLRCDVDKLAYKRANRRFAAENVGEPAFGRTVVSSVPTAQKSMGH